MHVIDEWANWLSLKVSPATHRAYRWEIDRLANHFPDRDLKTLKLIDLTAYLAARRQSGAGDAAIYRAVNALRSFYGYHLGKRSPALKLPMKRPADRIQPAITPKQALDVLACCDTSKPIGRRDLALQAVMMDSGIRAAEVCRLDLADLQLDDRLFKVIVKGGQEAFGSFSDETASYLAAWLGDRVAISSKGPVFVGFKPRGASLTPDGLRTIFNAIGERAGLPHYNPHMLRRTFATVATLMGAPTRIVQKAGRWRNLAMVQRYTGTIEAGAIAPYSPVSGIMRGAL